MPQSLNLPTITVSDAGVAAIQSWMLAQAVAITSLVGAITVGALTLTVNDASNIGNVDEILIDGEAMSVTARSGKTLTVTRADLGTTAAAHADGAMVTVLKYKSIKGYFKQAIADAVSQIVVQANYAAMLSTAQAAIQ